MGAACHRHGAPHDVRVLVVHVYVCTCGCVCGCVCLCWSCPVFAIYRLLCRTQALVWDLGLPCLVTLCTVGGDNGPFGWCFPFGGRAARQETRVLQHLRGRGVGRRYRPSAER